jgi:uncharacterized membrane protein YhaH (DUF805 family)
MSVALLLSGTLWLLFHYFATVPGEFGDTRHPLEAWWLRLHGGAAMGFLIVFGTVLPVHVRRAWDLGRNRPTGAMLLCVICALLITGYALYYVGSEEARPWISAIHWAIGLMGVPALVLHVFAGKRTAAGRRAARRGQRRRMPAQINEAADSGP